MKDTVVTARVVEIQDVCESGYTYIGNGDDEAILPSNPLEASDILHGFMGATQKMTREEFVDWRSRVLKDGPIDRYISFYTPQLFIAKDITEVEG